MSPFERESSFSGKSTDLPAIIEFIEEACEDAGVLPDARFDITLAVEEACMNVIEHAYRGKGGMFSIRFEAGERDLKITISDRGRPFRPQDVAPPDTTSPLEDRPIGGLGLHLMYRLMDEVRFDFLSDGNRLVLVKQNVISANGSDPLGQRGNG